MYQGGHRLDAPEIGRFLTCRSVDPAIHPIIWMGETQKIGAND
jgi:hypothetical protein